MALKKWLLAAAGALLLLAAIGCGHSIDSGTETTASTPWPRLSNPELTRRQTPINVGFLVVDGVYNTELTAPYDVFQHTIFHAPPGMSVFTVSPDGRPVTTFEGLVLEPHYSFADAPKIEILIVPSAENSMTSDLDNVAMIDWVRKVGSEASYIMSLCDGAFVLAKAGLLDGLISTTFPSDQDRFNEMFPNLTLRRGVSFVHDGKAITSEGGAKSFDAAMYLTDQLYGVEAAQGIGRGLLIDWPPPAGHVIADVIRPTY